MRDDEGPRAALAHHRRPAVPLHLRDLLGARVTRVRTEGMFCVDGHGRVRDRLRSHPLPISPAEAGRDESEDLRAGERPIPRS